MNHAKRTSKDILEAARRITRFYSRSLFAVLCVSFLTMLIQAVTDITEVAAVPVFLFGLWLLAGPVVLILFITLRLRASKLQKQETETAARESEQARIRQIATFRAAEEAREAAREREAAENRQTAAQERPLPAGLPEIIPTVKDGWKDKALEGRKKADVLEGTKPDVYDFNWQDRLAAHAERLNRFASGDIELMRKTVNGDTHVFRMRQDVGYYYIVVLKPAPDGELRTAGWGPLSPHNVLRAAYPDHPEVIARVLAAAGQAQREELEHALNDMMDEAPIVAGVARSWSDMLYLSRETVILCKSENGIEVRIHTERNPTPRNPDPRKIHRQRWLSVSWTELTPRSESVCLRLFRERNPLESHWWIGKLAGNADFLALFKSQN